MILPGLLLAFAVPAQDVHGLNDGENLRVLQPVTAPAQDRDADEDWLTGRVFHALTGEGLGGVRVRAFGEDYFDPREEAAALAETRSAEDGSWAIALTDPRRADTPPRADIEKLLFDRPGWRGTEQSASGARGRALALFPAQSPAPLAVLDLAGRPIPGAVVSTTISCSHAPPCFVAIANASGIVDLASQPPGWDGGDLQISAPGFGVLDDLDGWDLALRGVATGRAAVFLPRRSAVSARILGEDGEPLATGRVLWQGDPWRVTRVQPGGHVVFDSPPAGRGPETVFRLGAAGMKPAEPIALPRAPEGASPTTRVDSLRFEETWRGPTAKVTVRFVHEDVRDWEHDPRGRSRPEVAFLHESGHSEFRSERGVYDVPLGPMRVVIGGAFSGWREEVHELVVDGPRELVLQPRREPRLLLDVASDMRGVQLFVQAGDDSITTETDVDEPVFVPRGRPVTLAWSAIDGSMRTLLVGPIDSDRTVRIDSSATQLAPPFDPRPQSRAHARATLLVRARDTSGLALEGLRTTAYVGTWDVLPAIESETTAEFEFPAGLPYTLRVAVEGYATRYHEGRAGAEPQVDVALKRKAWIAIDGDFHAAFVGAEVLNKSEAAQGRSIVPGPTQVVLLFADGGRMALDLVLVEGTQRRIRVK